MHPPGLPFLLPSPPLEDIARSALPPLHPIILNCIKYFQLYQQQSHRTFVQRISTIVTIAIVYRNQYNIHSILSKSLESTNRGGSDSRTHSLSLHPSSALRYLLFFFLFCLFTSLLTDATPSYSPRLLDFLFLRVSRWCRSARQRFSITLTFSLSLSFSICRLCPLSFLRDFPPIIKYIYIYNIYIFIYNIYIHLCILYGCRTKLTFIIFIQYASRDAVS